MGALVGSPWFQLALAVIAIVGLWYTILSFTKPTHLPIFYVKSWRVLGKETRIRGLKVTVNDRLIDGDIVHSRISFWNRGKERINYKDDVAGVDPIRLVPAPGVEILDPWIQTAPMKANQFAIAQQPDGSVHITFDYIGPGEGCIIGCLRTSVVDRSQYPSAEGVYVLEINKELTIQGTVKGAPLHNYKEQQRKVAQGFVNGVFSPLDKPLNKAPGYVAVPVGLVIVLPVFFCLLPIILTLALFDGLRGMTTSGADKGFI